MLHGFPWMANFYATLSLMTLLSSGMSIPGMETIIAHIRVRARLHTPNQAHLTPQCR